VINRSITDIVNEVDTPQSSHNKADTKKDLKYQLEEITNEIKELVKKKKDCSHQLGLGRGNDAGTSHARQEMQQIKQQLKQKKQQKKNLLEIISKEPVGNGTPGLLSQRFRLSGLVSNSSPTDIRIIPFTDEHNHGWDNFVKSHPNATPYHFCSVRKLIKNVFGKDDYSLMAVDDSGNITGVLPLIRLSSILFGDFLVSMPYFNYGGPLARDCNIETALVDEAARHCELLGVSHMEIREIKPRNNWPQRTDKVCMIKFLPKDYAELETCLGTKVRAQTKRAERENVQVLCGGNELLDAFYHVFSINMRDLGTPVYSREFFRAMLDCPEFHTQLIVVNLDTQPVAAAFLLGYGELMEIPWASTLKKTNAISMNMYLYRQVLMYAIERGYRFFDFGRSSLNSPTYRFKQQWGAEAVQNYWHYWLRGNQELPQLNPNNPKYRAMIRIWQMLPVMATNLIGPHIVKNLP